MDLQRKPGLGLWECLGVNMPRTTCLTFIVNIGRHLDVALLSVHWQVVEVFILLQGELSTQLYVITIFIHSVDQHGVVVIKLKEESVHKCVKSYSRVLKIPAPCEIICFFFWRMFD